MDRLFHVLIYGAQAHPQLALAIVAVVAFAESLAIIGTVIPAAVVMFAGGALVGQGVLGLVPTLAVAVLGAVAGDALSFELGRRYERLVRGWRIFRRHLGAVGYAAAFVRAHGAFSVVLARFTGAVRAFVPMLAGFGQMSRARFYAANVGSALLWAPVHILPGVLLGGSLQLAEAVSGRLAMMILLLVGLVALAVWIVTRGVRWLLPMVSRARWLVLEWAARRAGRFASLVMDLLDPQRPGSHALLLGAVVLVAAGWLFLGLLQDVAAGDPMVQADQAVHAFLQALRTRPVDRAMVVITEMGSASVLLPVIVVTALWLVLRGARRTLVYWIGSVAVAELLVEVVKLSLGRQRPGALHGGIGSFSFPSGHATMSTVVFGFLAFLVARGGSARWRAFVLAATASYVTLVSLSRLYLGAHWLSDVLAGASLGLVWVSFCAMVYVRRQVDEPLHARQLAVLTAVIVVGATATLHRHQGAIDEALYTVPAESGSPLSAPGDDGWPGVPRQRREFGGDLEERFDLQWACTRQAIEHILQTAGWQPAAPWNLKAALGALTGRQELQETPVLPRFDRGQPSTLNFVRPIGAEQRQILRLWRSTSLFASNDQARPIWYGALYAEQRQATGLLRGMMKMRAVEADPVALETAIGISGSIAPRKRQGPVFTLVCQ